jgi:hypothetical protein
MAATQSGKPRGSTRKNPPALTKPAMNTAAAKPRSAAPRKKKAVAAIEATNALPPQDWRQLIATAAYLRAEARGFTGGSPEQDWLEAEKEVAARLAAA